MMVQLLDIALHHMKYSITQSRWVRLDVTDGTGIVFSIATYTIRDCTPTGALELRPLSSIFVD